MGRLGAWVIGCCLLVLVAAAPAHAGLFLSADATGTKGHVRLGVVGNTYLEDVEVGEVVDGTYQRIAPVTLTPFGTFEFFGELGRTALEDAARWRCDRQVRLFTVFGTNPEGVVERSDFTVRTPSCANRLRLEAPARVGGRRIPVTVRDTFALGGVTARLCRRAARRAPVCADLRLAPGRAVTTRRLRVAGEGRWRLTLDTAHQGLRRTVAVGVRPRPQDLAQLPGVLATGDSLMQGLDAVLEDRLGGRALVDSDVHIGTGLAKPLAVDWRTLPAKQVRRLRPEATLLFLGVNDGAPIRAGGQWVECCGQAWTDAYERRARTAMDTYRQGGRGRVYWLAIPAAKDQRRAPYISAVNHAVYRASQGVPGVRVVDFVNLFTPGGVYTDSITWKGEVVRVRQGDGIHLSTRGAEIAAEVLVDLLERDGVL